MATVPFEFECDKESGFVMDPNVHKRFGYLLALDGFGLAKPLDADLTVSVPYNAEKIEYKGTSLLKFETATQPPKTTIVGVIEKFAWPGGVGDPIEIEFYCSQENATNVKALQQMTLKHTKVKKLAWWIADYDQEAKQWFEAAFPLEAEGFVTGIITGKENPVLDVDLSPQVVKDGIDVNVYKVKIGVVPAANQAYTLHFANSVSKKVAKSWGLVVGKLATDAMKLP